MAENSILLVVKDPQLGKLLRDRTLRPGGYQVELVEDPKFARAALTHSSFGVAILEETVDGPSVMGFAAELIEQDPSLSLILIDNSQRGDEQVREALKVGFAEYLKVPIRPTEVLQAVRHGMQRHEQIQAWVKKQTLRGTDVLRRQVNALREMERIGRSVTASLDLDRVLMVIVDTAVELTGAEEGSLLILDETSGELMMRAARNFQDDFVRTFRLPVEDTLAGEVIRTGKPLLISDETPKKIKTTYLVRTLLYVPLKVHQRIIGVLGVDNREKSLPLSEQHLTMVSTLADYAAIAIENARLYHSTEVEKNKLEAILNQIGDGVIVIDNDQRIVLVNRTAREMFQLGETEVESKPFESVFRDSPLLEIHAGESKGTPVQSELTLEGGRVLNVQRVDIPNVGQAVTVQDITYFKELDRVKSEFVSTVSHDLRSPLTAILGYVELITRVGEVNDLQRDFIRRVQISVRNITDLINDLLDLGRIEAGMDARKEWVPMGVITRYAVEALQSYVEAKDIRLILDVPDELPQIYGDPIRLRQVVDNLLGNAVRYTPKGGQIRLSLAAEDEQMILRVADSGIGIPLSEQAKIFEKFYRGSNVPEESTGSGLGLAIVKSIVENHQGRVWVESTPGRGTCFTVVLPIHHDISRSG